MIESMSWHLSSDMNSAFPRSWLIPEPVRRKQPTDDWSQLMSCAMSIFIGNWDTVNSQISVSKLVNGFSKEWFNDLVTTEGWFLYWKHHIEQVSLENSDQRSGGSHVVASLPTRGRVNVTTSRGLRSAINARHFSHYQFNMKWVVFSIIDLQDGQQKPSVI